MGGRRSRPTRSEPQVSRSEPKASEDHPVGRAKSGARARAISECEGPAKWEADEVGRRAASRKFRAASRRRAKTIRWAERRPEPERERSASAKARQNGSIMATPRRRA